MGDMADWYIESAWLDEEDWLDDEDLFLSGCDDVCPHQRWFLKQCKFCGEKGLHWQEVAKGQWRLADKDSKLHECREYETAKGE